MRDVINGCAGDVMDLMAAKDSGSVSVFGKRIGETNGLAQLAMHSKKTGRAYG